MLDEAVDRGLVGAGDAERGLEILAGEREAVGAVVGGADDDEQGGIGALEDFLEAPGVRHAAAAVAHARDEGGPEQAVGLYGARQAGPLGVGEETVELQAQGGGLGFV